MIDDRKIEILKKYGAENIKDYLLVNNYGYGFDLDGEHYDIRFWANCYGMELNRWEVMCIGGVKNEKAKMIEKEFNEEGE